jgi:O-methyltransferase
MLLKKIQEYYQNYKINKKIAKRSKKMPVELTSKERDLIFKVRESNISMTSYERLCSTVMSCKYVIENNIKGDFVECGVWRGGNALLAALIFRLYKYPSKIYLYDTFEGMTEPSAKDVRISTGALAIEKFLKKQKEKQRYASIEDVKNNFKRFNLLNKNIIFVKGDVLKTLNLNKNLPKKISILRLDTDWYESTKKELEVLYPKLVVNGVLIIDDYGFWAGSKQATDEYFKKNTKRPFLQYVDSSGRCGTKPY